MVGFHKLPYFGNIAQTKMTYTSRFNLSGLIPAEIINKMIPSRFMYLDRVRLLLSKSLEIDTSFREGIIRKMRGTQDYSSGEDERLLQGVLDMRNLVNFLIERVYLLHLHLRLQRLPKRWVREVLMESPRLLFERVRKRLLHINWMSWPAIFQKLKQLIIVS